MALPVLPPASAGGMSRFAPKSNLMSESPAVLSVRPLGIGMGVAQCGGQAIGAGASIEQKRQKSKGVSQKVKVAPGQTYGKGADRQQRSPVADIDRLHHIAQQYTRCGLFG